MKRTLYVALALSTLAFAGCGSKDGGESAKGGEGTAEKSSAAKAGEQAGEKAGDKTAEAAKAAAAKVEGAAEAAEAAKAAADTGKAMLKEGEAITPEVLEQKLLGLTGCEVKERGIDRSCEAYKAYTEAKKASRRSAMKNLGGLYAGLGQKHIGHEHPAVRIEAARVMSSIFGASKDSQAVLVKAAEGEKNPVVLREMLRAMGSAVGKNESVQQLLMKSAEHENDKVRIEALSWLTSSWARGTEGTLEKAIDRLQNDPAEEVRRYACKRLGDRGDERALKLLESMTSKKVEDDRMYSACFEGLVAMWSAPVPHETPSEKAYKLTLKRLKEKPRTGTRPPWTAFSRLRWAKKDKFQERAPWFKPTDVHKVLQDIVKDRKANWMARTGAVDALGELGADTAVFDKLAKAYKGAEQSDAHVLKKIEKVKKKMADKAAK